MALKIQLRDDYDAVRLAGAKQANVTLYTIAMRNAMAQRDRVKAAVKVRVLKRTTDQRQARMRGKAISIGSHKIEAPHVPSPTK